MSTDLHQRIADVASSWEREAPAISITEITGRRRPAALDADEVSVDGPAADVDVVPGARTQRRDGRRSLAIAAALLVAVSGAVVLARRSPDQADPVSPATTPVASSTISPNSTVPTTTAAPTTAAPTSTAASSTTTAEPALLPADVVAERLALIADEQRAALRGFTTIGFTVTREETLPDGSPYETGGPPMSPARVVMRNDGSVAVTAASFGTSYYDAVSGTAQAVFTGPDGGPAYQQIDGQADSSVALGVPTGLANGVVTAMSSLAFDVVAIEEDMVGGRSTWRIDQRRATGFPASDSVSSTSTWIDRATGITLRTMSSGGSFIGEGDDMTPIVDTITLSDLVPDEVMPAGFPVLFPPDANVERSGDAAAFAPITLDAAAAEVGPGGVVPTIAADQVSIQRIPFGTADGGTEISPSLIVRWFDGFLRTELRVVRFPSSMVPPASCPDCSDSLLEQLAEAPPSGDGVSVGVGQIQVTITGDPERFAEIIDSLVTTG